MRTWQERKSFSDLNKRSAVAESLFAFLAPTAPGDAFSGAPSFDVRSLSIEVLSLKVGGKRNAAAGAVGSAAEAAENAASTSNSTIDNRLTSALTTDLKPGASDDVFAEVCDHLRTPKYDSDSAIEGDSETESEISDWDASEASEGDVPSSAGLDMASIDFQDSETRVFNFSSSFSEDSSTLAQQRSLRGLHRKHRSEPLRISLLSGTSGASAAAAAAAAAAACSAASTAAKPAAATSADTVKSTTTATTATFSSTLFSQVDGDDNWGIKVPAKSGRPCLPRPCAWRLSNTTYPLLLY